MSKPIKALVNELYWWKNNPRKYNETLRELKALVNNLQEKKEN